MLWGTEDVCRYVCGEMDTVNVIHPWEEQLNLFCEVRTLFEVVGPEGSHFLSRGSTDPPDRHLLEINSRRSRSQRDITEMGSGEQTVCVSPE